jgi:hypothetical protein
MTVTTKCGAVFALRNAIKDERSNKKMKKQRKERPAKLVIKLSPGDELSVEIAGNKERLTKMLVAVFSESRDLLSLFADSALLTILIHVKKEHGADIEAMFKDAEKKAEAKRKGGGSGIKNKPKRAD